MFPDYFILINFIIMFRLLNVFLMLVTSVLVSAQCTAVLRIINQTNYAPINASIMEVGKSQFSNALQNEFSFTSKCNQTYSFNIAAEGFKNQLVQVFLSRDTLILVALEPDNIILPDLEVLANRLPGNMIPSVTNISGRDLQKINSGKDIPFLLESVPSTFSTSDAGNQVGYTGLRIRGSDQTRINVTINGIPVNDAESQNVFWVDLPDLSSSVDEIQIQRGVGTSSFGAGSFGANINILTKAPSQEPYLTTAFSGGTFNTFKRSVLFGTGLLSRHFTFEGRWSAINSDGYIDRATSDLDSYYGNLNYLGGKNTLRLIAFSGIEKTYQSWYGVPESVLTGDPDQMNAYADRNGLTDAERQNLLNSGRTYNYYEYEDQTDNYRQNYFQLIYSRQLSKKWLLTSVSHLTQGKGFYEEWKPNHALINYGLQPVISGKDTINFANIVRRRWLDNSFYGTNLQLKYEADKLYLTTGLTAYKYDGDHFGEITWIDRYPDLVPGYRYYQGKGMQTEQSAFGKVKYQMTDEIGVFADLQYRHINYKITGQNNDLLTFNINKDYQFINPKLGVSYHNQNGIIINTSVGRSNSQPFRDDFINAPAGKDPKPEQLTDYELEFQKISKNWSAIISLYFMKYKDQLVLTGELNEVGASLRTNVPKSTRQGVEFQLNWQPLSFIKWSGNCTLSNNSIETLDYVLYDYENGGSVVEHYHKTPISYAPSVLAFSDLQLAFNDLTFGLAAKHVGRQFLDNTGNASKSIQPFTVLNTSLSWKKNLFGGSKMIISAQVFNIANLKYSNNGYTYSYLYGGVITENFYYPQAGRHFMLSCKVDW